MSKQPKSHLKRLTTFDYINSAILLLVAVCCMYPFLYVFFVATTDGTYLARGEMTFLPMGFNLKAFGYILTNPRFNVFAGMRQPLFSSQCCPSSVCIRSFRSILRKVFS